MSHATEVTAVIDYIEEHLTMKLDLDSIAKAVHYSKYYLHRVFTETVGMTVNDYIRRRQLTEAAKLLVFTDRAIVTIALLSGYKSQQAFTSAFTAMYKIPPNRYREQERFYPLQLRFDFEGSYEMLDRKETVPKVIRLAGREDIPDWMRLVNLVVDGFPNLQEEEYLQVLNRKIAAGEALILKDGEIAVGVMLFSYETGSIDFMGCHPLYRRQGIPGLFLDKVMKELLQGKRISITTYREGDKADTGYREEIKGLGFAEAELLVEYGYPTQRFVIGEPEPDPADGIPFPDEVEHLRQTGQVLREALDRAEESVLRADREYRDTKRYMVEHRGDIDPHEMFQNELLLKQSDRTGAMAVGIRDRLAKLMDSPYFARIDFREDHETEAAAFYIGRFAFQHNQEALIFDWRAPISSMFYDCEVGKAGFLAPEGWTGGDLTRKRQFKICGGVMEYALESSANVQDDVLQRELSHASDEKMKSIISTIQKEQNQIIRNEKEGTLIIQGVAGSGKTSIALHRIAFLLYRFQNRLRAEQVTILSPNKVFGDYISNVIPELGEEPVYELSFEDLARIQLEGLMDFHPERDVLDASEEGWRQRVQFKSTLEFVDNMDWYIRRLPDLAFLPEDYRFGRYTVEKNWIGRRFHAYENYPIRKRLEMAADDIHDRLVTDNWMEAENIPRPRMILKSLNSMLVIKNTLAAYQDFYKRLGKGEMLVLPAKKTLEWSDVYPFLYLHAAFEGVKESGITRHLIIDEMQDYTPVQYAALNRMFPCQKTILGDFGQFINPNHLHTLKDLRTLYEGAEYVELNKSYRSTYEIITFARSIQDVAAMDPVERHGEMPAVVSCASYDEELEQIQAVISWFRAGEYATLGIILKTEEAARTLYEALGDSGLNLLTRQSSRFQNGVSVMSIPLSKGLEFDEVLIPQADEETYTSDYDRSLLYIACTRAMHRLTLTYTGRPTKLMNGESHL